MGYSSGDYYRDIAKSHVNRLSGTVPVRVRSRTERDVYASDASVGGFLASQCFPDRYRGDATNSVCLVRYTRLPKPIMPLESQSSVISIQTDLCIGIR